MARPEVTGRKPYHRGRKRGSRNRRRKIPVTERSASTITEFCEAHRISRTRYYELKDEGLAPDEMVVGRRRLISNEAAARWRAAREAKSGAETAAPAV
jgi:hypothetical protein